MRIDTEHKIYGSADKARLIINHDPKAKPEQSLTLHLVVIDTKNQRHEYRLDNFQYTLYVNYLISHSDNCQQFFFTPMDDLETHKTFLVSIFTVKKESGIFCFITNLEYIKYEELSDLWWIQEENREPLFDKFYIRLLSKFDKINLPKNPEALFLKKPYLGEDKLKTLKD